MKAAKAHKPRRTPESEVLQSVLSALRSMGLDVERQNTGGRKNASGRYVPFGRRGNADITGMIPAGWVTPDGRDISGKKIDVECKAPDFRPEKLRGEKRALFDRQLARLRATNTNGGYGFWVDNPITAITVVGKIRDGWRIVFEGDYPFLDDGKGEPR